MKLWRGDNDPQKIRQLRTSVLAGEGLFTNMINSGNPLALSQQGFLTSIHQHIVPGWNQSHFLSFSKSRQKAEEFAVGRSGKHLSRSHQNQWDAIVAEIDIANLTHRKTLGVGIEHYQFQEAGLSQTIIHLSWENTIGKSFAIKNRRAAGFLPIRNVMLIDVFLHLSHLQTSGIYIDPRALANSQNDQEILILPLDPLYGGGAGNTALLDMGCFCAFEFYNLI